MLNSIIKESRETPDSSLRLLWSRNPLDAAGGGIPFFSLGECFTLCFTSVTTSSFFLSNHWVLHLYLIRHEAQARSVEALHERQSWPWFNWIDGLNG